MWVRAAMIASIFEKQEEIHAYFDANGV